MNHWQTTYQRDFPRHPSTAYRQPRSSHGTLAKEGIFPARGSKEATGESRLRGGETSAHVLKLPKGINNAKTDAESRDNCSIVCVAALVGKRASDVAGTAKQDGTFFCQGAAATGRFGADYLKQKVGMREYLAGRHPHLECVHDTITERLPSEKAAVREMKRFPVGTQFLVYTETHLKAHWLYAENTRFGVQFFDFQIDRPTAARGRAPSSSDSGDHSGHSDLGDVSTPSYSGEGSGNVSDGSDVIAAAMVARPALRDEPGRLDNTSRQLSRPHPVRYADGKRYLLEPTGVGFLAFRG